MIPISLLAAIEISSTTLGLGLIALGIFVGIAGYYSYKKGGRTKMFTLAMLVIVSTGYGVKLLLEEKPKPTEVKQAELPKMPTFNR